MMRPDGRPWKSFEPRWKETPQLRRKCRTHTTLDTLPYPQPSPWKTWGEYFEWKRRTQNFAVNESFRFGYIQIKRTHTRTFVCDDGYITNKLTGQSTDDAFKELYKFLSGDVVKMATTQIVH